MKIQIVTVIEYCKKSILQNRFFMDQNPRTEKNCVELSDVIYRWSQTFTLIKLFKVIFLLVLNILWFGHAFYIRLFFVLLANETDL